MTESVVEKYFKSDQSFLFSWTDQGRELCWLDGTTIAFHEELALALERLALGSLPKFSSVVLGMAAMRSSWPDVASRISRLLRALVTSRFISYAEAMRKHRYLTETWETSAKKLGLMSRYAAANAKTPAARAELLSTLFDRFESGYTTDEQKVIALAFRVGLPEGWTAERKGDGEPMTLPANDQEEEEWRRRPPVFHRVLHDVLELLRIARLLASGLHDYSEDDLRQRIDTGIAEEITAPEESPLEPPLTAAELLDSLQDDSELGGFSRLTRHLLAAVSLPRTLSVTQEIRAGGVSDISNRGRLDQLLLSELAFDDLTLAVRVASNEAMYLRHETPPSPQAELRPVLIDTSLPMWGIPKLYATATAMALHAGADSRLTVECFRPSGKDVEKVRLQTREELSEQLAALSPTEHAGAALAAFERTITESKATAEPVLITTSDPLASHTFRFALDQTTLKSLWIIVVERDGRLTVMQRTRQGTSVRKTIHLPLEEILRGQTDTVRRQDVPESLPAIFGLQDFPLLLSHQTRVGRVFTWNKHVVSISDDGRLMLWEEKGLGAKQLCEDLPRRGKHDIHLAYRSATSIEFYLPGEDAELVRLSWPLSLTRVKVTNELQQISDVRVIGTVLLTMRTTSDGSMNCTAIHRKTGQQLVSCSLGKPDARNGRCVRLHGRWNVLSFNGTGIAFQELPQEYQDATDVMELSHGDFVAIAGGGVVDPRDVKRFSHFNRANRGTATRLFGYLPGSDRLGVVFTDTAMIVNVATGEFVPHEHHLHGVESHERKEAGSVARMRGIHWRFRQVGADGTDGLRLQGSQGRQCVIGLKDSRIMMLEYRPDWKGAWGSVTLPFAGDSYDATTGITETTNPTATKSIEFVLFQPCRGPHGVGYRLSLAEWPNGNKAWLDSRGLLHLKNANAAYPEVTLTLRDGELSGWLSSGEVFGEDYTCGRNPEQNGMDRVTPEFTWKSAIKPFLGSVPWSFHYSFNTGDGSETVLPEY